MDTRANTTPEGRKALCEKVVSDATAAGEAVPESVKNLVFREATAKERAFAQRFVPVARALQSRHGRKAA